MNFPMKREDGQGGAWIVVLAALIALGRPTISFAQHSGHMPGMNMDMETPRYTPHLFQSDMSVMSGMTAEPPMDMGDAWSVMTMGVVRLLYNDQGGASGDHAIESSNWAMGMLHRSFGPNQLSFMLMCSLEPATIHVHGSPELFQTGESFQGKPL